MAVAFKELWGSPEERFIQGGVFQAVRRLKCAWADRYTLIDEIAATDNGLYTHRPAQLAYAVGATALPFPGQAPDWTTDSNGRHLAVYTDAVVRIFYMSSILVYSSTMQKFVTESLQPNREAIPLDPDDFVWHSDGAALGSSTVPVKTLEGFDYILTIHKVDSPPAAAASLNGYCNAGSMGTYYLGFGFEPETLKYHGPYLQRTFQLGTLPTFSMTYRFAYRAPGWNTFWRPDGGSGQGGFESIRVSGQSSRYINVPLGNFNLL
jgi:hypothetical protein